MAGVKCNWFWVDGRDILPEEQSKIYLYIFFGYPGEPVWTFMLAKEGNGIGSM